jgi:methylenetetrahydrofolate reductase (NADPH)
MRISVELVPHSADAVLRDAKLIRERFPWVTTLNIPDLMRFPLRSWDACARAATVLASSIPHIRAIDIAPHAPLHMIDVLQAARLTEVLVVSGDPPHDINRIAYSQSSIDVIRRIKRELPHITVYAALDPYRQGFRAERDYMSRKLDAGANGFFTQPFFDRRLLEIYAERLENEVVFWGITPVLTSGARAYWETTNNAIFPRGFEPTMEWNRAFARDTLRLIDGMNSNAYLMPIRIDLATYLDGLR